MQKIITSACDVADGGFLYITLLKSDMPKELGFDIETDKNFRKDAFSSGDSQSRIMVSVFPKKQAVFEKALRNNGVNFTKLGKATGYNCHVYGDLLAV